MTTPVSRPPAPPAPVRLSRLQVSGFRSIRTLDLELGDLTVLVGANGAGKTNLVAFFNLVRFILSENLQFYTQQRGGASSILHYGPKTTPNLEARLTFNAGDFLSMNYAFSLAFAAPDRLFFASERIESLPAGDFRGFQRSFDLGAAETNLRNLAELTDAPELQAYAHIMANLLQGLRVYHFHDTSDTSSIRTSQDVGQNRSLLSTGGNLWAFLHMLQQTYTRHYEQIIDTIRLAVPYLKDLILVPNPSNPQRILLRWRDRNPEYEFGVHQLSDGSLRAIALITALMQPEEFLPALIAIDEPELGLHPAAIATVAQLIKAVSSKRQAIVATQSSRLLANFAPEDVVVVEREEDEHGRGASTFQRLSAEALGTWRDDYDLGQLYDMNVTGGGPR